MTLDRRIYSRTLLVIAAIGLSSSFTFAQSKVTFDEHITPILRNHCFNCHSAEKKKADFDASSYIGITAGGGSGEVLAAGDPSASLLWKLVNHEEEPKMPPKSAKIPDAELAVIKKWIEGGLLENSGSKAIVSKKPKLDLAVKAARAKATVGEMSSALEEVFGRYKASTLAVSATETASPVKISPSAPGEEIITGTRSTDGTTVTSST